MKKKQSIEPVSNPLPDEQAASIVITQHAFEQAKERFSWTPKALEKMASKAFTEGIAHSDTKGKLNRYISKLWFKYPHAGNIRIYGENIFFFCGITLVTLYQVPNELRKLLKNFRLKKCNLLRYLLQYSAACCLSF